METMTKPPSGSELLPGQFDPGDIRVDFVSAAEAAVLRTAKERIVDVDCKHHCRHFGGKPGKPWDPTACARFRLDPYLWCNGYEQDAEG